MKKRILSMLLAIVMVVGLIPNLGLVANAAENTPVASVTADGVTTNYTDITGAINAAKASEGSTLKLLDDITTTAATTIDSGTFTIDLNGKTWQCASYLMEICGNADIKITDSTTAGTGKLCGTGSGYPTIQLYDAAKLEIAGGTVENGGSVAAIDMVSYDSTSQAQLTVSGGSVVTNGSYAIEAYGTSVTVAGGTMEGYFADIYYGCGKINMTAPDAPMDITICMGSPLPDPVEINLPEGYHLYDVYGQQVDAVEEGKTYTASEASRIGIVTVTDSKGNVIPMNGTGTLVVGETYTVSGQNCTITKVNWYPYDRIKGFYGSTYPMANGETFAFGNEAYATGERWVTETISSSPGLFDDLAFDGVCLEYDQNNTAVNAFFQISANLPVTEYPLWVGGEQFTSAKLSISGGSGTAGYDPDTNTLTLNNYSYNGPGYDGAAIYYGGTDTLNLVLLGDNNSVTHSGGTNSYGIYAIKDIKISGTGSLTAIGGNATTGGSNSGTSIGIYVGGGDITISGGTVKATGQEAGQNSIGIFAAHGITISGGTVEATGSAASYSYGICAGGVVISGGETIAQGNSGAFFRVPTIDDSLAVYDADDTAIESPVWTGEGALTYAKIAEKPAASTFNVKVSAVDTANGNAIAGATMQLIDSTGNVVDEWVSEAEAHTVEGLKTDEVYTLRVAVAPDGYVLPSDITFSIDESGNVSSTGTVSADGILLVEFAKTTVKVSAVETGAGESIEGAHLQILDAEDKLVDDWVSALDDEATGDVDESIHEIAGLNTGEEYTLHTAAAPDGYAIAADTTFTIRADGTLRTTGSVTGDGVLLSVFDLTVVQFSAVDAANGNVLAGATMQVLDKNGDVVEEWVSAVDDEATEDVDESVHTVTGLNTCEEFTLRATVAPDGYAIPADTTFEIDQNGEIKSNGTLSVEGVLLVEFETTVTKYPLWVGMQQFTENLLTITDSSDGTATYDPQTHTLTLNNFTYSGMGNGYTNEKGAIFYHGEETLTLHLVGKSSITYSGNTSGNNYGFHADYANVIFSGTGDLTISGGEAGWVSGGIYVYHDLTLSGTGKLNVIGKNGGGISQGIYCAGALTISDGTVNITTGEAPESIGIRGTYGAISVDGGSLKITCGNASDDSWGIYTVYGGFVCSDGTVTVTSGNAPDNSYGIYSAYGDFVLSDGTVTVTSGNAPDNSYGIYTAYGDFVLSDGTVTVTGGICGTDEDDYSCGIVAQNILVHDGHLTAVSSTAANSVGIYAFETATLYGGVLEAAGQTVALNKAPAVDSGFVHAAVWYGDSAETAIDAKPIGELADNYSQKYVKVAAVEPDTYTVTIRADENGTVTADKTTAAESETVTITVTPDEGKQVDQVTVKDASGKDVPFTDNGDGTYTFIQPAGDVTIEVTFENIPVYVDPSYRPTIEDSTGGNTTVSNKYPEKGDKVTITTKPDKGYEVGKVAVTDGRGNQVEVKDNGNGTYTYIQPVGSVTIRVTYKPIGCPSEAYSDLDTNAWYHEAADYVLSNGLMNGVGNGKFDPNGTTSRAMIVTILWRLEGEPVVNYLMQFEDVATETWYTEAVRWAASEGIVTGYSDVVFGPNDAITREQLATILYRYEQYKGGGFTGAWMFLLDYTDRDKVSDWAYEAMCWTTMHGVINGKGDGILDPKGSAKRCEAAQMLMNYLNK